MTVASIDIGTNTVLLLISEIEPSTKKMYTILDRLSIPRIGKGLEPGKKISDENLLRLYTVLDEYIKIIKTYNCDRVFACATNAFRIASNSLEISEEIKKIFDLDIKILSGETEALFSFLGALSNTTVNQESLVIDIGGGSTEIIIGDGDSIKYRKSFRIGVVSLSEKYFLTQPPSHIQMGLIKDEIITELSELRNLQYGFNTAIAVAGTPTTLSCIKNNLKEFNSKQIEGNLLSPKEIDKIIIQLSHLTSDEMRLQFGNVMEGREDIILCGALILKQIIELLNISEVVVSTRGIRHGVIVDYLNNI